MTRKQIMGWGLAALGMGAILLGGKTVWSKIKTREIFRAEASKWGFDPDWFDALIGHESGWNAGAINDTGPDAARGGAWGASQITVKTARAYGFMGQPKELLDPRNAAYWTAKIATALQPRSLDDLASLWNAGRRIDDPMADKPEAATNRDKYVSKLRAMYGIVTSLT